MITVPFEIYFKLTSVAHHCYFHHLTPEAKKIFLDDVLIPMNKFNHESKEYQDLKKKREDQEKQLELEFGG